MNLKDEKEKILKKYSYSKAYKNYFEISTNQKYFPFKRISLIIFTFLFFFLISYKFTLPKLENESLYIFAAQVTIIALIFPIILTLIGILYSKNNDFDSIFKIYIANTNAKTLYRGSFILLLFYVISFFYLYDSSLSEQIRRSLNVTLGIMFIDAIIVTLFFLEQTISFTTTNGVNKILTKHFINSEKNDESVNIISIITNRINENIQNSDLNSFEKNIEFLLYFLDKVIIISTEIKDNKISSNLNKTFKNDLFSTKFSKIIFLIQKNIELAINSPNPEYYQSLHSVYFYIFCRNYKILENESILLLLQAHYQHTFFITKETVEMKPKIINDFISSWYKWLNSYIKLDDNLTFYIFKNHLNFTALIINTFSKDKNIRGLDFICDCLSRWEDVAAKMPNYVEYENKLQTIFDFENLDTFANLVLETKILSFYLISKNLDDNKVCYKYYEVLIKGKKLIKTTDLMVNSYSFQSIDEILFSYFRLLSNHPYEHYFNNFLEELDRIIEISGLIHGGWIPFLENRITNYIIKLLLLNTTKNKSMSGYLWESAFENSSIAKNDKILNLLLKIQKEIINFNNYDSLEWDSKKLEITKKRLSDYIENLISHTTKCLQSKFELIELDQNKVEDLVSKNTLHTEDLINMLQETFFSFFFNQVNYNQNIVSSSYYETYDSKYLTTEYSIHLDNIFKPEYYASIIENLFFEEIQKIKRIEYLLSDNIFQTLQKIYLKSCIFSLPIVIYNNNEILEFLSHYSTKNSPLTYIIKKLEHNMGYKIGKTIFKYEFKFPKNSVYILPNNILKNIYLSKTNNNSLSKVDINLDPKNHQKALVKVDFPCEIHLEKNSLAIEIILKKSY
ncbi:hypothetical protein ABTD81_13700 [Acinetobacter baumannii]|nr:hypothetical protein [Acinetobacter baumannii]